MSVGCGPWTDCWKVWAQDRTRGHVPCPFLSTTVLEAWADEDGVTETWIRSRRCAEPTRQPTTRPMSATKYRGRTELLLRRPRDLFQPLLGGLTSPVFHQFCVSTHRHPVITKLAQMHGGADREGGGLKTSDSKFLSRPCD